MILGTTLLLVLLAVGRQRGLEPLSPPDLAFFHQSTWSAAHGEGFAQTALPFEGQGLLDCAHLSLVRALLVPFYALAPSLLTLVALQALAIGLSGFAAASLARSAGATPGVAALAALIVAIHPLTIGLATADLRPIVFLAPGILWLLAGAARGSLLHLAMGGLLAISAREEALWVLLAAAPGALWLCPRPQRTLIGGALLLLVGISAALPLLVWGRLTQLSATTDHAAALAGIRAGHRALFRAPEELRFGILALLVALPAVRAPLLLLPAAAAWAYLAIFSSLDLAVPQHQGIHYLAVAWPLLMGAAAVGIGKLARGRALLLVLPLVALVGQAADLPMLGRWMLAAGSPPAQARRLLEIAGPVASDPGGVVAEPRLAPWLANRAVIVVRGNLYADRGALDSIAPSLDWALLEVDGEGASGRPAQERRWWRSALQEGGLERQAVRDGVERWGRAGSP